MKKKESALSNLAISFDKQPAKAGTPLTGQVSFVVIKDPVFVKDVRIKFEGKSKVVLSGDVATSGGKEKQLFSVEILCMNELSSGTGGLTQFKFAPGNHSVPFAFPVPQQSPNSFTGKYGVVRYQSTAKVTLTDSKASFFEVVEPFAVECIEDLNWYQDAVLPVTWRQNYTKRSCGIKKFDIVALLKLSRTGYTLGDEITMSGEVINRHKRRAVAGSTIQLIQRITYRLGNKTKTTKTVIARTFMDAIQPEAVQMWEDVKMTIPPTAPPSFLRGVEDISVAYEVTVTIEPGLCFGTPVVVGTMPYSAVSLRRFMKALPWHGLGSPSEALGGGADNASFVVEDVLIPPSPTSALPPPPPPQQHQQQPRFFGSPHPPPPPYFHRPPAGSFRPFRPPMSMRPSPPMMRQPMPPPPPPAFGRMPPPPGPPPVFSRPPSCWAPPPPFLTKPLRPYYYYTGGRGGDCNTEARADNNQEHVLKIEEIVD